VRAELARRQHQQQQPSNTNPNHYIDVSIPFSVPQSTAASNYHLVSDPNGTNNNGGNAMPAESTDIYGSDSASSSAGSSFVHLPLAAVDSISGTSLLVRGGYDNVSFFFFFFFVDKCAHCFLWDHPYCHLWTNGLSCPPKMTVLYYSRVSSCRDFYRLVMLFFFPISC
jgi:hypothetical protein